MTSRVEAAKYKEDDSNLDCEVPLAPEALKGGLGNQVAGLRALAMYHLIAVHLRLRSQ